MIEIQPNKNALIARIIILILIGVIEIMLLDNGVLKNTDSNKWYFLVIAILPAVLLGGVLRSFLGITKVRLNNENGNITFSNILFKTEVMAIDLEGYYVTYYNTKHGTSYGKIIKTKNGEIKKLNPANLQNITDLDPFLIQFSVKYLG